MPPPVPLDPRWDELVRYHLACVQRAGLAQSVEYSAADSWVMLPFATEQFLAGTADSVPVGPELRQLFDGAGREEAVFYGWPLVVALDRRGVRRVAPVAVTALEPPTAEETAALAKDAEPYLNPALLSEDFFPPEALAAARAVAASGLAFGDAEGLAVQLADVLIALGFDDRAALDPQRLSATPRPRSPGVYNAAVAYRGASNGATAGLVEELTQLRTRPDWSRTAARYLLEQAPEVALPDEPAQVAPLTLNDSQEQALAATGVLPVTVITGPPGTGKSQLVAATVAAAWLRGETVLVASTNNEAVKVAVERAHEIDDGLLIRTGNAEHREALPPTLEALAGRPVPPGVSPTVSQRQLEVAVANRTRLHDALAQRAALEGELGQLALDLEARRTLLWGQPRPSPVHDRRVQLARRARRVERSYLFTAARTRRTLAAAEVPTDRVVQLADLAEWAEAELRWDALQAAITALGARDPETERDQLAAADHAWEQASLTAVQQTVATRISAGATALKHLARLRRGAPTARMAAVAGTLPSATGWACTALSAGRNFPLTAGLFDLVVIDEASQCGVAEVLPLAYRAKRLVIVGDPNQLTPVVTLAPRDVATIAASVGSTQDDLHARAVSYGQDSAFTAFARRAGRPPFLLDEHYRCHPEIAAYVNEAFYGGSLRVLTDVSRQDGTVRGLHWLQVAGHTEPGPRSGAVNHAEADAIVRWVLDHPDERGSLGVVTPFAAQAELIEDELRRALGEEQWTARGVAVGTAHRFQGGERDIVLFSPVLASDARHGTARWVEEQRNLVNVAVSRARRALVVAGDALALAQLPTPTLAALADAARREHPTPSSIDRDDRRLHSEAERRLYAALTEAGLEVQLKPVVDGYELDFAVVAADGRQIDVECDGTQHTDVRGRQRRQDLVRDLVLQRLGWQVLRIPAWRCLTEPRAAAHDVADAQGGHPVRGACAAPG
ncbi:AAA domain-containing protein [Geodermatophilus sp. SYSU D00525]